jgi:hypothetical protein
MAKPQHIRQSICAVCGKTARPGSGVVLEFGAGGRVHSVECLAIAQSRLASLNPRPETLQPSHA